MIQGCCCYFQKRKLELCFPSLSLIPSLISSRCYRMHTKLWKKWNLTRSSSNVVPVLHTESAISVLLVREEELRIVVVTDKGTMIIFSLKGEQLKVFCPFLIFFKMTKIGSTIYRGEAGWWRSLLFLLYIASRHRDIRLYQPKEGPSLHFTKFRTRYGYARRRTYATLEFSEFRTNHVLEACNDRELVIVVDVVALCVLLTIVDGGHYPVTCEFCLLLLLLSWTLFFFSTSNKWRSVSAWPQRRSECPSSFQLWHGQHTVQVVCTKRHWADCERRCYSALEISG